MRMIRQLGREDWIYAGLEALARNGPLALRVEAVARALGVSKGSFYWHFRDRNAWRDALLAFWEYRAFAALVRPGGPSRPPLPQGLDVALRDWGRQDVAVALCLQRVAVERRGQARPLSSRPASSLPEILRGPGQSPGR